MRQMLPVRPTAAVLAVAALAGSAAAQCSVYRLYMPDLDQRRSAFPNNGSMYCVPTATADALAYIANHGYPDVFGGPASWASGAKYAFTTERIAELADWMGTDPTKGTGGGGWWDGVHAHFDKYGYPAPLMLVSVHASGFDGVDAHQMANLMKTGAIVLPGIGWYKELSPSFYERTGGHLVCMQGAFDLCSSEIRLTWSDPANDSMLTGQGPFTTMQSQLFPQINFFARKDKDPVVRRMWRFGRYDSAFLDGIYAICPQAGLTTDASLQDITYTLAPATTSGPIRPAVRIPIPPDEPIIAVDYGLLPTQAFVLTASDGRLPGALWRVDLIDETVEQVASPPRPRAMATGRDGTVYVAERGTILRYGSTDHDTFGQVETISLPSQIDAICYDDANDRLLALSVSDRRLMLLTRELQLVRNDPLPPAVALAGHASIAINPADQSEWIATSGVRELTRLVRDPGSLRIIVDERLAIAEIDEPHAVHFTVDGGLAIADVDEVHLFVPDFVSGWKRATAAAFDGTITGRIFRLGRSRTNWDPAIMATVDDISILPPDTGPGDPVCPADLNLDGMLDFFDFLEFQDLFAASDTHADFTFDGALDFFDFLAFQNAFAAGCP